MSNGTRKTIVESFGLSEEIARMQAINNYNPKYGVIKEFTFIEKPILGEEGNDEQQQQTQDNGQNQPPVQGDGAQQGAPSQPIGAEQGDAIPPVVNDGQQQPPMGVPPMDAGPVDGVGTDLPNNGNGAPADNFNTDVANGTEAGDEVIDVDELTQSQTDTEHKVDDVDAKLSTVLTAVQTALNILDKRGNEIEDLKAEIERRNPTPEEKLNIRSQSSFPYSSTPKQYWDEKTSDPNSNYSVSYENGNPADEDKNGKYDILAQDVNNIDVKKVADSLDFLPGLDDYLDKF